MQIYEILKKDHRRLQKLLNELVLLSDKDNDKRHSLIKEIRDEFVPHTHAEESVFYNSLRSLDPAKDIVMNGYNEHMEAENLLRTLQVRDKIDLKWRETAEKFKKSVDHHIQEEETKIFNVAEQLFSSEEATMMGEAFEKLKPEAREEGFVQSALDMVANIMPARFAAGIRTRSLHPRP